jgi:hypothetical protein
MWGVHALCLLNCDFRERRKTMPNFHETPIWIVKRHALPTSTIGADAIQNCTRHCGQLQKCVVTVDEESKPQQPRLASVWDSPDLRAWQPE